MSDKVFIQHMSELINNHSSLGNTQSVFYFNQGHNKNTASEFPPPSPFLSILCSENKDTAMTHLDLPFSIQRSKERGHTSQHWNSSAFFLVFNSDPWLLAARAKSGGEWKRSHWDLRTAIPSMVPELALQ